MTEYQQVPLYALDFSPIITISVYPHPTHSGWKASGDFVVVAEGGAIQYPLDCYVDSVVEARENVRGSARSGGRSAKKVRSRVDTHFEQGIG